MASRDNLPNKYPEDGEDSSKRKYHDKHQWGNRRSHNYARNDYRDGSFFSRNSNTVNNGSYYYAQNSSHNRSQNSSNSDKNVLSWRKPKNIESLINQRESLVTQIHKRQYECMICYMNIELEVPVWSCENCYHIFHISCIKKWSNTCGNENSNTSWRCPACQKEYDIFCQDLVYFCYCGKMKNPFYNRGTIPHSCGEVCGKSSKNNPRCPHLCSLLCHPGPCPLCEASLKCNCHCGKEEFVVKCSASESNLSCGKTCGKLLNCSFHTCKENCHSNNCSDCTEKVLQKCFCEKDEREVLCGSLESKQPFFTCDGLCKRPKDCGIHKCERKCHPGPCQSCDRLPENTQFCACGKTCLEDLPELKSQGLDRRSCADPIPVCGKVCDKTYPFCDHKCPELCHEGGCPPCSMTSNVKCRCNKTSQNLKCSEIERIMLMGDVIKCTTRCKSKKLCGIHRCQDTCCDIQVHICTMVCGRTLSCKKHSCERPCHQGNCLKCDRVSFDELFCECGAEKMLPPIDCGKEPPHCSRPCSREHGCDHEVSHTCHSDPQCSPCTVLTSKECPGGHKFLYNIPCFRPVVTCGLPCNKPLLNCSHLCIRICHEGPCADPSFVCGQLCTAQRGECAHPCNRQCHSDDCESVNKPCQEIIEMHCSCLVKKSNVTCDKLGKMSILLRSEGIANKRDIMEFYLSEKENCILLTCDQECKKVARSKQLAEAFEIDFVSFDHVAFSAFLRDFSIKNPHFLIQIDSTLCGLIKKLETEKLKKSIHRFDSMNREKRRFIQEISDLFALTTTIMDADTKCSVVVEAVKGICKIPNNRLIHFIQKNYPQIFKTDKPASLKNVKTPPVSSSDFSYAERMKSINQIKKS